MFGWALQHFAPNETMRQHFVFTILEVHADAT